MFGPITGDLANRFHPAEAAILFSALVPDPAEAAELESEIGEGGTEEDQDRAPVLFGVHHQGADQGVLAGRSRLRVCCIALLPVAVCRRIQQDVSTDRHQRIAPGRPPLRGTVVQCAFGMLRRCHEPTARPTSCRFGADGSRRLR